jgi:diguanylate cyclase (GGDEF)-like protein
MGASVLIWTRFVVAFIDNQGRFGVLLKAGGWMIFTFQLVTLIINFFTPIVFEFMENDEYKTGPVRNISLVLQMILFIIASIYTLSVSARVKGETRAHHRTIGFSEIVMSLFILLQCQYPLMPFYSIGCLLATCTIHSFVYKDEMLEHFKEMEVARRMAFRDPLTGVRNKLAYLEVLKEIELRIERKELTEYGVAVFDLNGLKEVNDTRGHDEGDEYIKSACSLICHVFQHSPVFRIGGDEFAAVLERDDYQNRKALLAEFNAAVEKNLRNNDVVVACGIEAYDPKIDTSYNDVFRRADKNMYVRKEALKEMNVEGR